MALGNPFKKRKKPLGEQGAQGPGFQDAAGEESGAAPGAGGGSKGGIYERDIFGRSTWTATQGMNVTGTYHGEEADRMALAAGCDTPPAPGGGGDDGDGRWGGGGDW